MPQSDTITDTVFVVPQAPQLSGSGDLLLLLEVVGLGLVTISVLLLYSQIRKSHEWNRRKSAHDLIFEASLGRFRTLRDRLESKINIYEPGETYSTQSGSLGDEDRRNLDATLNFLENVCLGMKHHIMNEDMLFDSLDSILLAYVRWAKPYIKHNRDTVGRRLWIDIDPYAEAWENRRAELLTRMAEADKKAEDARKKAGKAGIQPGREKI